MGCSKTGLPHDVFDFTDVFPAKFYPKLTFSSPDLVNFAKSYLLPLEPKPFPYRFCGRSWMATLRQRARMDALRSALELHRHRHFNAGCNLVVLGGACAPSTKIDTNVFDNSDHEGFDFDTLSSPQSSLSLGATLCRHLVVSGGVVTTAYTHLESPIVSFAVCDTKGPRTCSIFIPCPSRSPYAGAFCLVVLGYILEWPRAGMG